jgi:hypothetical protein
MAWKNMTKTDFDQLNANSGSVYSMSFEVTNPTNSDDIIFPISEIYAIAASFSGTGGIEFTNDRPEVIKAGNATFVRWDGVSEINKGLTGFKVVSDSGVVTATVTVKTTN